MGRPPKAAKLSAEQIAEIMRDLKEDLGDGFPMDPVLLARALRAVTQLTRSWDVDVHHHVRKQLGLLKLFQVATEAGRTTVDGIPTPELITAAFDQLAAMPTSRVGHNREGLSIQREQVIRYFLNEKFPTGEWARYQSWLHQRWEHIMGILVPIRCPCEPYETSYEKFLETIETSDQLRTTPNVADLILATLHHTLAPGSVRKYARS